MRTLLVCLCGTVSSSLFAASYVLSFEMTPTDLPLVEAGGYTHIQHNEGLNAGFEGTPDIPRFHRWLAVDARKKYRIQVKASSAVDIPNVKLRPVPSDVLEGEPPAPLRVDGSAYAKDGWWGEETAVLGDRARLGTLTILPVTITPVHYHPVKKILRYYTKLTVTLVSDDKKDDLVPRGQGLTPFVSSQAAMLVSNQQNLRAHYRDVGGVHLIVTTDELLPYAREVGALQPPLLVNVQYEVVPKGISSTTLRQRLYDKYPNGELSSVLLFGDESHIPLHQWSSDLPGDWYHTLLYGGDSIADIGLGRLPVTNATEAQLTIAKLKIYAGHTGNGHVNKKVMLVAHKENYPGKYTANQEVIRKAPNPRNFVFSTHYGGAGGGNESVLNDAIGGFALINYRGHGGNTNWSGWAKDGKSFGLPEADQLKSAEEKTPVVFNIACNNGALQSPSDSLSERMLFPASGEPVGPVAALASTVESYTSTNDRFDILLFEYLQNGEDLSLGSIVAYANNKLVQEGGGALQTNTKMYLLLSDPLLVPWLR